MTNDLEITLHANSDESVSLKKKKSLLNKGFRIEECDSIGCKSTDLSTKKREILNSCTFEGFLKSEPDSKVNAAINCSESMVTNIALAFNLVM